MDTLGIEISLIVVSIILSSFFSASETALTSLTPLKVKHIMSELGNKAKPLELWIKQPNKVLNTILFFNNLVNILASVLATAIMSKLFESLSIAITTGVMTFVILVFGEIFPKTYAKNNAQSVALLIIRPLTVAFYIAYPITVTMNFIVTLILKALGKDNKHGHDMTEDELEFLINEGERVGVLEKDKGEMLTNIFDISDMQIKEVMIPRIDVEAISDDSTVEEVMELIKTSEFSRIPVYKESIDDIIGILYVKDIIRVAKQDISMEDIVKLLREPLFVPETKKIDTMLKEFQRSRLHFAVVVDEYGGTAGIITMEDILEEIVGDIMDEYDDEDFDDNEITKVEENRYLVDARMNIDDFCEEFKLDKTDDMSSYETLAGFVFDIFGEIPNVGDSFDWGGFRFTVKDMEDRKLGKIEVLKLDDDCGAVSNE